MTTELKQYPRDGQEDPGLLPGTSDSVYIRAEGCVVRFSKPERKMLPIIEEYSGIGFTEHFGSLRQRTPKEQIELVIKSQKNGVNVTIPFMYIEEGNVILVKPETEQTPRLIDTVQNVIEQYQQTTALVFPFVPGIPLSDFLREPVLCEEDKIQKYRAIMYQIADLYKSHQAGIVIGDRWGPNQIVTNTHKNIVTSQRNMTDGIRLAHIDIDLDITRHSETGKFNPISTEFEAAQVLYHLIYWTTPVERETTVTRILTPVWSRIKAGYDSVAFNFFLQGHVDYFNSQNSEYAFPESTLLTQMLSI